MPIGAVATGAAASAPWAAAQHPAASTVQQGAVPALHASLALGGVLRPGGSLPPLQPLAQTQQPGAALWSTILPLPTQIGGSASPAVAPIPPEAARAALFMSQLAAMQAAMQEVPEDDASKRNSPRFCLASALRLAFRLLSASRSSFYQSHLSLHDGPTCAGWLCDLITCLAMLIPCWKHAIHGRYFVIQAPVVVYA